MDIKEKAKQFAIKAHMGQVRKNEPDKPMIMHPLSVGLILEEYGYDETIVAAGFLHDVVEDTSYSILDIEKEFGSDIAALVNEASEPDKTLSWEERKLHTINSIKSLPLRSKVVICADKINNLEDIMIKFHKTGERDFSRFKRGEQAQRWYYTSVYESLVNGENTDLPLFIRLQNAIQNVFGKNEDKLKSIFVGNEIYYQELKKLHAQKQELQHLKKLCDLTKPFVIEFSGTPRTGKTTLINNLYDFFKKGGFNVQLLEEFTTSKYYKEKLKKEYSGLNAAELNIAIIEEIYQNLQNATNSNSDIILIDRSINDRQIWNYRRYVNGDIDKEKYLALREKYQKLSQKLIDFFVITTAEPFISLKRDYLASLALEDRSFLNIKNISEYNDALTKLGSLFENSVEDSCIVDTSQMNMNEVATTVTSEILPVIRKRYINTFKEKYKLN